MGMSDDEPYIPTGFGKILRDDTGNFIGFEYSKSEERPSSEVVEMEGLQLEADAHQRWAPSLSSTEGKYVLRGELIECYVNPDFSHCYLTLANYFFLKNAPMQRLTTPSNRA